jgi:outer membrane protein OmpA-like peptidoglycan-associated protein
MLCALLTSSVIAAKPYTDHPLVGAYEGSTIHSKEVTEYDEYTMFKGWEKETKRYITDSLEGKVTKLLYTNPEGRSILEIFRNYEKALAQDGAKILYTCNQEKNRECMDTYVGASLRREFQLHSIYNKDGRYLIAKLHQDTHTAYIMLGVGQKYTDIHIVEMQRMEEDKVSINMQALSDGLDTQGYVVVEGIFFDTDKTTLKPESQAAIAEVAKLLDARPELSLYVVGHTDMQGSLSYNMNLSKGRAQSVVDALVSQHAIAASRLEGHGVGPLSPDTSNKNKTGRFKNRRVVLVHR